ncbi:cytosolic phospholipase A2 gamma-like, partial [Tautogolabrus adspersus]
FQNSVRQSQHVCAGEQVYVQKRKQVVLQSLNSLGINCSEDSVPHIALLGSGGGQRAAVALLGSLHQMKKDGLLDSVLYLGGVSGSTWSMSSLYSDPQWSVKIDTAVQTIVSSMTGPDVEWKEAWSWLSDRVKKEDFSLTDIWGALISSTIMKKMDLRRLSDEASRNATNPYPIYCAVEKYFFSEGSVDGKWFEVSPHEAGFTDLGLFIETSLLGSKLQGEKARIDMVKLQGICGSALADGETDIETITDYILKWLSEIFGFGLAVLRWLYDCMKNMMFSYEELLHRPFGPGDLAAEEKESLYGDLHQLIAHAKDTTKDRAILSDLEKLQQLLEDEHKTLRKESESKSLQRKESDDQQGSQQLSLESGGLITDGTFIMKVIHLLRKWEWGTTNNFLYKYQNSSLPPCLHTKESFHLVDAGLLVNVAYPSFLGDKRDIDLIIALDYSAGNAFETLTVARDYAAELKKPFPEIDEKILEEKDWPKDCYVFEGKKKEPTIVFMPLFNRNNCKDAEEVTAKMSEFSTFQLPYSQDQIVFLLKTGKENMKRNKETLLREFKKAAERRRSRKSVLQRISQSCLLSLV